LDRPGQGQCSPPRQPTALRIFATLHRFAETGKGDVKSLKGRDELRLRIADYRLFFVLASDAIEVRRVLHRSEAYR
jgi:mRNA interferase RelE/StbE